MTRCIVADRRGAAAIIVALTLVPLLGCVGLALDFGMTMMAKAQIQSATDAAAMKAITVAAAEYTADPNSSFLADGQTAALAFYRAQLGQMVFGTASLPTITVTRQNNVFNATVTAQAAIPTLFATVLGFNALPTASASASSLSVPSYVAIQILMDESPSMGLLIDAASNELPLANAIKKFLPARAPAAGNILVAASAYDGLATVSNFIVTPTPAAGGVCGFACHFDTTNTGPNGFANDYYGVAQASGFQMRIDVLRSATQSVIQQAIASPQSKYIQIGLYGFGAVLQTITPLGTSLATALAAAQAINVIPTTPYCGGAGKPPFCNDPNGPANGKGGTFRSGHVPNTNFDKIGADFVGQTLTPKPVANGLTPSTALRYVFLITDGFDDYTTSPLLASCCNQFMGPINTMDGVDGNPAVPPSTCDTIKAQGATIIVLYTTYNIIPGDWATSSMVGPYATPPNANRITAALQACASPGGNYFQANSPAEIQASITKMLALASARAGRYTQ